MIKPTLAQAKSAVSGGKYSVIPISTEIFADLITPVALLKKLQKISGNCFILESAEDNKRWGRYTFLGFSPKTEITCLNGVTKVDGKVTQENPNVTVQRFLDQNKSVRFDFLPPFTGGLMGYFAYDYAKYCEPKLNLDAPDNENFNDVDLMFFDKIIAFDNFKQKIIIIVNISTQNPEENLAAEYEKAVEKIEEIKDLIQNGEYAAYEPPQVKSEFKPLFTKEEFCEMVEKVKDYIKEGDIFQAVVSNRLEADFDGNLLDIYRIIRTANPSPYMFYFSGSSLEIAGASPETLVKLQDGKLHTFPLAGTRPRGADAESDAALEKDLLNDEKELAEHNMLVDLGRNDLGKISKAGSVNVDKYMEVLRFSHVMHIGSEVSGEILDGKTGLDAINAVLPAGTLSGAPKIRAMQIINELERNKRGIYGGAIGYLDLTGNMDACIAIRIAYKKNGKVFIRSGAGVVADSVPVREYEESINKAEVVKAAFNQAVGGVE